MGGIEEGDGNMVKAMAREAQEEWEVWEKAAEAPEYDAWFRQQVQVGLDAADAGDFATAEEMKAEDEAWYAKMRRRVAGETLLDKPGEG